VFEGTPGVDVKKVRISESDIEGQGLLPQIADI
jgi:hypothetical protein